MAGIKRNLEGRLSTQAIASGSIVCVCVCATASVFVMKVKGLFFLEAQLCKTHRHDTYVARVWRHFADKWRLRCQLRINGHWSAPRFQRKTQIGYRPHNRPDETFSSVCCADDSFLSLWINHFVFEMPENTFFFSQMSRKRPNPQKIYILLPRLWKPQTKIWRFKKT